MMMVQMDKVSAPSSRDRAQCLYDQIVELENRRRRSAQARIPSDPNTWQQMRENYEAIILEDHSFSEQHNVEYALWQLHYKRIEELRAHFNAALASTGSNKSQGVKGPARPDRVTKIRLQFKTFLSEATGFYHDLIVKIRAKYGLPLGHLAEGSDNQNVMEKDGKKSSEIKKGFLSCHRSLIYLGDLARYKGLYGEGDSRSREYAAASSYYLQAASLWPSSGNPHHQLAILASYSGDELLAIYRYFRSLAVESPFSTARENLIVAYDKNRQSYSRLFGEAIVSTVKESPVRLNGKGRGKSEPETSSKDNNTGGSLVKEKAASIQESLKSFCTRFVRLNGILFTRTSLETFVEVLSLVSSGLRQLLSSGPEEELNFGADAVENGLLIVRLVSVLIFTVHNVNRESEGQSYAEILQRTVLLQNAFNAFFELMGHILERCLQLHDPSSSFLLSGILVFVEWLACCPDVAARSDVDEKQASIRSNFWNLFMSFLNKLLSIGLMPIDDDKDETCFYNMNRYEGETENRMALWEDFELRGFLPLLPAQSILDFSTKRSFGNDGQKERRARARRILAAGKALANIVRVDKKAICFDSKGKKFVIGAEPQLLDNFAPTYSDMPHLDGTMQENHVERTNLVVAQTKKQPYSEGEEEDEVIVFKPIAAEKRPDVVGSNGAAFEALTAGRNAPSHDMKFNVSSMLAPVNSVSHQPALDVHPQASVSVCNTAPQHFQSIQSHGSNWLAEEALLANGMSGLRFMGNGHVLKSDLQDDNHLVFSAPPYQSVDVGRNGMTKTSEALIASKADIAVPSRAIANSMNVSTSSTLSPGLQKISVSRPARHLGPPPGFSTVPPKPVNESMCCSSDLVTGNPIVDDYSWLDGYQVSPSMKGSNWLNGRQVQFSNKAPGFNIPISNTTYSNPNQITNSNVLSATVNFPFPGKQVPTMQSQLTNQEGWQNYLKLDNLKLHQEQMLQQQQLMNGTQNFNPLPDQYQGQSGWTGHYVV